MRTLQLSIVLGLLTGALGCGNASAPYRATNTTQSIEGLATADELAIRQAIEDYANGFIQEDMQMLLDLWDTVNSSSVTYVAAELDQPIVGVTNLAPYYQSFLDTLIIKSGNISNLQIFQTGDTAYAFCNYTWVYENRPASAELVQPTRATFVLVKRNGHWLYQHFHESISFEYEPPTSLR
ncbi:YybH family protein [Cystobacter fuscus]